MLVLSRKKDEKIFIGPNGEIEVTVVEIRGNRCRLGIKAPPDMPIVRGENYVPPQTPTTTGS